MVGRVHQRVGAVLNLDRSGNLVALVGIVPLTVGTVRLILGVVPDLLLIGDQRGNTNIICFQMVVGINERRPTHSAATGIVAARILQSSVDIVEIQHGVVGEMYND